MQDYLVQEFISTTPPDYPSLISGSFRRKGLYYDTTQNPHSSLKSERIFYGKGISGSVAMSPGAEHGLSMVIISDHPQTKQQRTAIAGLLEILPEFRLVTSRKVIVSEE